MLCRLGECVCACGGLGDENLPEVLLLFVGPAFAWHGVCCVGVVARGFASGQRVETLDEREGWVEDAEGSWRGKKKFEYGAKFDAEEATVLREGSCCVKEV